MIVYKVAIKGLAPLIERLKGAGPLLDKECRQAMTETVLWGEADVKKQIYPGHGVKTGRLRGSIHGDVRTSYYGEIMDGVHYGKYVEAGHHSFAGYRMFGNVADVLAEKGKEFYLKALDRVAKYLEGSRG